MEQRCGQREAFAHRAIKFYGTPVEPGDCRMFTLLTRHPPVVSIIPTSTRSRSARGAGFDLFVTVSLTTPKSKSAE